MLQSYDATPQIFLSGRILKAEDFGYKEMFVKVRDYILNEYSI